MNSALTRRQLCYQVIGVGCLLARAAAAGLAGDFNLEIASKLASYNLHRDGLAPAGFSWTAATAAGTEPKPDAPSNQATPAGSSPGGAEANPDQILTPDQLYDVGRSLFDQYAPAEIKEQYDFPTKERWDAFAAKLQRALDGDSIEELAQYEPQARAAAIALRTLPGYEDYADWLEERLDLIQAARSTVRPLAPSPGLPPPAPPVPGGPRLRRPVMPYYDLWLHRLGRRPTPPGAADLMPTLRARFSAAGVPPEFAWIAEVESTLNPKARSPSGAKGLFQLMPETAKNLGLSTWFPDERADPAKSADAASRLLRNLHARFGDWPLALAAYNAGAGRVERLLAAQKAKTFGEISPSLPVETRFYVPKVCATIALRTGLPLEQFAGPE
jgi:membrane-bound lytic murein transglycosylase D